jgi:hypothetical protein
MGNRGKPCGERVVAQFDKEASQTRECCVAKCATRRAARPDPSLRNERLFGMTIKLSPATKGTRYENLHFIHPAVTSA